MIFESIKKLVQSILKYGSHWLLVIILLLFVFVSWLALPEQKLAQYPTFNSPDETANYLFSQRWSKFGQFKYNDVYASASQGYILPRSLQWNFYSVVPVGFVGLPLIFGFIAQIIGSQWIIFLTPVFMSVSLLFLYLALTKTNKQTFAWLTIIFICLQPAWLYSAARPLMTTGLFASFVIMSFAWFLLATKYQRAVFYALSGLFLGASLLVRLSEGAWLLPLGVLLLIVYWKKIYWPGIILAIVCLLPPLFLHAIYNYHHFGSALQFGYNHVLANFSSSFLKTAIFPFGVNLSVAWQHWLDYSLRLFPVWSVSALIALFIYILYLLKDKKWSRLFYLIIALLIVAYLIVYYGSWTFYDNPDPMAITIGNSYVRYFLPITLLSAPLLSFALTKIKSNYLFFIAVVVTVCILGQQTYQAVWQGPGEGIIQLKQTIGNYQLLREQIISKTPSKSIIITNRMDKVAFPLRRVVEGDVDWQKIFNYSYNNAPFYQLTKTMSPEKLMAVNKYLKNYQLKLLPFSDLIENYSLYHVIKTHENIK
jgi:hypothetical protein